MVRSGSTTLLTPAINPKVTTFKTAEKLDHLIIILGQADGLLVHFGFIHHCTSTSRLLTGRLPVTLHQNTHLEVGFPLRCFQRLSSPHLATLRLQLAS